MPLLVQGDDQRIIRASGVGRTMRVDRMKRGEGNHRLKTTMNR